MIRTDARPQDAFHRLPVEEVARLLSVDPATGLTDAEAAERLATRGPNTLPAAKQPSFAARLLHHLTEPMTLLLASAAAVAGLGLGETTDAAVIMAIVAANTVIAMTQEGRAARALEALRTLQAPTVAVRRSGVRLVIPASEVVPGDVVELASGDGVPADIRWVQTSAVEADESTLTGESLPVRKDATAAVGEDAATADQTTMSFAGTLVVRGSGRGVVVATGGGTKLGAIAAGLRESQPTTPLQQQLRQLTAQLGLIAVAVAALVFTLTWARSGLSIGFLSAVALAVAAVPEGLPTVVTVSLALGVRRMASRGAIVRRLPAVETLGSADVILSDKTGTLTQNRMRVDAVAAPGADWHTLGSTGDDQIAAVLGLCNDATITPPSGDPMEVAMLEAVGDERVRTLRSAYPRVGSVPFDAERRRMVTLHGAGDGMLALVKGAPEVVLPLCTAGGGDAATEAAVRERELARAAEAAATGARVLALAYRSLPAGENDAAAAERDLTPAGLVALRDPVRPEAAGAVSEAASAGVRVVMVTGDHPGTAASIAGEVGLPEAKRPVTGVDLRRDGIPSEPLEHSVYARVEPDDKLALVKALQDRGHVVAVTGDGVNDAPALRRADIGAAMGRTGSDVARQASDMVITDDNLATIVAAVREGRGIYDNIRKVVDYLIAGNLSEILVVVVGLLAFPALGVPLLPLQLLWINLLTDGLPAVAFGVDRGDPSLMRRPPRRRSKRLLDLEALGLLLGRAIVMAAVSLGSLMVVRFAWNEPWTRARAVMFSVLVIAHLLYAFIARAPRRAAARGRPGGWLVLAVLTGIVLQVAVIVTPALQRTFGTTTPTTRELILIPVAAAAAVAGMIGLRVALSRRDVAPAE